VTFTVEWRDTLAANSWSTTGVTQTVLTDNGTLQSVKVLGCTGSVIESRSQDKVLSVWRMGWGRGGCGKMNLVPAFQVSSLCA
jgi:hypothetical protein